MYCPRFSDAFGHVASRTLGNGIAEQRTTDNRGRLTGIVDGGVMNRSLTWNTNSTLAAISDGIHPVQSQSFAYDAANRLITANGLYGSITYSYDANGNRLSRSSAQGLQSNAYQSGSNRLVASGGVSISRDAAGNRLSDGRFSYTYAVNNRLIAAFDARGHKLADYVYNGRGERVMKRLGREGERTTWFMYDPSGHLVAELAAHHRRARVTAEYIYGPTGRLATIAVRGDDGRGMEERGHRRHERDDASESVYWHINDHLGTPQALTDRRGRVAWAAVYMPFGNIYRPQRGEDDEREGRHWKVTNNFRFPGQYFDGETGLNYNYFRDYDPTLGRYVESDPIGLNGGLNPFGYVGGDPVIYSDPKGQFIPGMILGAVFGGVGAWATGGSIVEGMAMGAATGFVGVSLFRNVGIIATMAKNSIIAGAANAISQLKSIQGNKACSFNYQSLFASMVGGALGTLRGYGATGNLLSRISSAVRSHLVSLPIGVLGTAMGK